MTARPLLTGLTACYSVCGAPLGTDHLQRREAAPNLELISVDGEEKEEVECGPKSSYKHRGRVCEYGVLVAAVAGP